MLLCTHNKIADSKGEVPYEVKMYTPISVRASIEQCDELDNKISVLIVPLPTRMEDKVKRVRHIGKHLSEFSIEYRHGKVEILTDSTSSQ